MKIGGLIIQNRNIKDHSEKCFDAKYKGKRIYITDNHGFGNPKYKFLTRYAIGVSDVKTGFKDVLTYGDFHEMRGAILFALVRAMLL